MMIVSPIPVVQVRESIQTVVILAVVLHRYIIMK
jgi:hypothetical protein